MLAPVHHYRITVNGPPAVTGAVLAELERLGAQPARDHEAPCVVVASADALGDWEQLSRRHPDALLSIESFEALEDRIVDVVVRNGASTVMADRGVLPDELGGLSDEDGTPLDADLLRVAAGVVAANRRNRDVGSLSCGLDTALTMGGELGSFCDRVQAGAFDDPSADAIDAVVDLAVVALWVSACGRSMTNAECEFEHAVRLTQAMLRAGHDELADRPGQAPWSDWIQILLGSASDVVDAACQCDLVEDDERFATAHESRLTPTEVLEWTAVSLLASCLQALALFPVGAAGRRVG